MYMIRMEDQYAYRELYRLYQGYVRQVASSAVSRYPNAQQYMDDIYAEAERSIFIAVDTYNQAKRTSYKTYLTHLVKKRCLNLARRFNSMDMMNIQGLVSLDSFINEKGYDIVRSTEIQNELSCPEYYTEYMIKAERAKEELEKLSDMEKKVWQMMQKDISYAEAAKALNINVRQYDGHVQRIKKKLKLAIHCA